MKNKFNCDWLSVYNVKDMNKVKVRLSDNGYWEYERMGIGMNKGRVFVVDLDDSGEQWREMMYCEYVKSIEECVKIGINYKVIEYCDGELYYEWESDKKDHETFEEEIGLVKGCGKLYSLMK